MAAERSVQKRVLRPHGRWPRFNVAEWWQYRELAFFLVWRDVKIRYKQTVFGILWAILRPMLAMVVFSIVFGNFAGLPSDGIPYPVFAYAGLLPWQLFSVALTGASNSLVSNQNMVTKVYFPRVLIPATSILGAVVDFVVAFVIVIGLMVYFNIPPTWAILTLPLFVLLVVVTALTVGLWLSALSVRYRDVRHILPFLVQFWLYATPVAYATSLVPEKWRLIYGLNPLVGAVDGFRWALLGTDASLGVHVVASVAVTFVLLFGGLWYFHRMESDFADLV